MQTKYLQELLDAVTPKKPKYYLDELKPREIPEIPEIPHDPVEPVPLYNPKPFSFKLQVAKAVRWILRKLNKI